MLKISTPSDIFLLLPDDWIECSTGSSFIPHVITVNAGEVHVYVLEGVLCSTFIIFWIEFTK